jgi:pathogenesis-related protein 1
MGAPQDAVLCCFRSKGRGASRLGCAVAVVLLVIAGCGAGGAPPGELPETFDDPEELETLARAFVDAHNAIRAAAEPAPATPLPLVQWREDIAAVAAAWAATCVFEHSTGDLGENLAIFSAPQTTPAEVVAAWASEVADYDYAGNRCAPGRQCGHYTQLVWQTSTDIGCGVAACDDVDGFGEGVLFVCNYDPPGNVVGLRPY